MQLALALDQEGRLELDKLGRLRHLEVALLGHLLQQAADQAQLLLEQRALRALLLLQGALAVPVIAALLRRRG